MKTSLAGMIVILLIGQIPLLGGEQKVSMSNVILLPVKNDPTVSFRIWFKVGSQNDPEGKEGLSAITASMLTEASTASNSYGEIIDKLYPLAASYSAVNGVEMTVIVGRVHKDNLKEYYPLLMDAILKPAFKQEDLDRIKSQTLNYLENTLRYASDEELGKAVLYNTVFRGTPYGHVPGGTIPGVKSITIADVKEFYRKFYTAENVVAGLGGGYEQSLIESLEGDLGRLPSGVPGTAPEPGIHSRAGFHVTIVEKEAASTAMSMGFPIDIVRGTKDWYALAIANSWLGEHRNSSSHLYQVIREERGLNYGDYSYIENYPNAGRLQIPPLNASRRQQLFEIWIRPVPNANRHFALRAALREYKKFVDGGLTQQQFDLTRNFLKKYILNYAPTTMQRLGYALDDRFYGVNGSHLAIFRDMMDTLTLQDVNNAVKKHLQYGTMDIVIVTSGAAFLKEELSKDMPSPITYKTPKPEHVLAEDKEIGTFPLNLKPEDISIVPVAELLER
ncbi:MAG TPA: pitrilysin family protein [Bacteroidota bacterium]